MAVTTTHTTYGAPVSIAVKRSVASKQRKKMGLVYPLIGTLPTITGRPPSLRASVGQGGYFSKCTGVELIRNNLRQLFLCNKGERIMLPDYGLSLDKYLFEPLDETTFFLLKNDILSTLATYFSIVHVIKISAFANPRKDKEDQVIVSLTLQLLDESLDIFDTEVIVG
jgi:phage baseplate assembly protein W